MALTGNIKGPTGLVANYSVSALKSASTAPDLVFITDSGKEGLWKRDLTDTTSADNVGTVMVDNLGKRWKKKFDGFLFASWFGVSALNTDNSTQLQNCINAASFLNIKKIVLPVGTIKILSTINIGNNTPNDWHLSLEGVAQDLDGRGTCIQNNGTDFAFNIDLRFIMGSLRGCTLKNFSIRGKSDLSNNGVKMICNQQSIIENVYFFDLNKSVICTGDSHYNIFRGCKTYNCNYGIKVPLNSSDADFVVNNANNNIVTGCWFDNCLISPLYLGDADSWTIENTDFEGGNGMIEISQGCVMSNVRIERNIYTSKWIKVRGDFNKLDISVFDAGGTGADWRVFVQGSNNTFTIKAGFAFFLVTESGKNNKYDIQLYSTTQTAISNLIAVRNSSSLIVNGVEQNVERKTKKEKGQNLVRGIGMTGVMSGTTLKNPHGTISDLYNVSSTRILNGVGTGAIPINVTTSDVVYCKTDIYIKSVSGETYNTLACHGLEKEVYVFDEWMGIFVKNVVATNSAINFNSYKDISMQGTGKIAFGLTKLSINEMPVDYFENSTTQTETLFDNCFKGSLELQNLSLNNISSQITTRKVDNTFKVITLDKQNLIFTSTANVFSKLDKMGVKLYRVDNSTSGVLPNAALKATLKGWSVSDFGFTKYLEIDVSRATTSDSWTYTTNGVRIEKGCIFSFANSLGSLSGTTLDNMTFEVIY